MNHYFFKFGEANYFFKQCIEKWGQKDYLPLHTLVPLSIYFGEWRFEEYDAIVNNHKDKTQIELFFKAVSDERESTVFWLFDDLCIYALMPQSKVYNGTMKAKCYTHPKSVDSIIVKRFPKEKLPEAFASINSSQKYNRKTIVKLECQEREIADWVFNNSDGNDGVNGKMRIEKNKRFLFLSPLQFETLVFLIFHHNQIFCTTYRGGTLKDVDFKVRVHKEVSIEGMHLSGIADVQVKKCDCLFKNRDYRPKNGIVLVHLGDSHPERRIYGRLWIENCLTSLPAVENWLNESLDFFKLSDEF